MTTHVQDAGHDGSGTSVTVTVTVTAGNTFTLSFDAFVTGNNPVSISSVADNASGGSNTWTYSTAQNNQNPAAAGSFDSTQGQYGFTATAVCLPSANGGTTKTFTTVTVTFSIAVAYVGATLSEFSGLAAGSVILTAASTPTAQNGVTSYTTPSLTTSAAALVLTSTCAFNAFTGVTAGYTLQTADTDNNKAYNTSVAAGSVSATFTGTSNRIPASVITAIGPGSATVALTTPNVALAAPLLAPSAGGTVALTAPNVALAAPLLAPTVGKVVALTTPNIALAAPAVALTAGASVALTAPNVALAAPAVTPPATSKSVALTTPNIALSAPLLTPPAAAAPLFPAAAGQLDVRLELNAGGTWVNVTPDLDHGPITIGRGHPDESTTVSPSTFAATLTNKTARYSPDNAMSDLWPWCVQNMPARVSIPAAQNYLRLEANNSDRSYVNDTASLHVTGSLDLRAGLRLSDWQGCVIAARLDSSLSSWYWLLNGDGTLAFSYFDSGGTQRSVSSDVPLTFPSGDFAVRVTLDATTGTVVFYTSGSIGGTWTQLGDAFAMTGGAATSVRAGNCPLVVGWSVNIAGQLLGRVYEFTMLNGIGGTVAADGVFSAQAAGATSWTDSAGNTWNMAGGAEISSRNYRAHIESSEWPQDEPVYNADENNDTSVVVDALVPLSGGGLLRRLSQRAPNVASAMYRAILAQSGSLAPVAYWPMEDAASATQFGAALGPYPMTWGIPAPLPAAESPFACSGPLPQLNNAAPQGQVAAYAGTGTWTVRFLAELPTLPASEQVLFQVNVAGGLGAYVIAVVTPAATLRLTVFDAGLNVVADTGYFAWTGLQGPLWWSIEAQPSGSNVQYSLVTLAPGSAVGLDISATSSSAGTAGSVTLAAPSPFGTWSDTVIGHVQVQSAWVSLFSLAAALAAHLGEPAGQRFARLCGENGIACRIRGNAADTIAMGLQTIDTLATLLQACADADQGVWTELRQVLGWGFVTRKALYGQPATATLSYLLDHLSPWTTSPARDDQVIVNDVTYTNDSGSSVRMFAAPGQPIPGGRMSTASPSSGGVGTYAQSYSVSVASDGQLTDLAGWRLHIGTTDQARLPGILVDLANTAASAVYEAVLALDMGDRLVISSPPRRLGFEPVTQLAQALTETLFYDTLTIGVAGVPELPYQVLKADAGMHVAPLNGILALGVNTTAASWSVTANSVDNTQLFSVSGADYPQDWVIDGERVTVTAVSGASSPQTAVVTRSVNGVVKSHSINAAVGNWPPPVIGL